MSGASPSPTPPPPSSAAAAATAAVAIPDLNVPRYDQNTFTGRLRQFLDVTDPRTLLPGIFFNMSLTKARSIMSEYRASTTLSSENTTTTTTSLPQGVNSVDELWLAKKIESSAVHPDTDEVILPPFRMSGFAVFGTPIIVGLLLPNPAVAQTCFFQTLNQSHNAAINFANRNASAPTSIKDTAVGFGAAVATSVGIALSMNEGIKRAPVSAATRVLLSRFVPYPAIATAGALNMFLMRRSELEHGIEVQAPDGTVLGVSQIAAKEAIEQTMITRIVLPAPLLMGPVFGMMAAEKAGVFRKLGPRARLPVEALLCVTCFVFGLPLALSCFPQQAELPLSALEARFHNATDASGTKIDRAVFNKGL